VQPDNIPVMTDQQRADTIDSPDDHGHNVNESTIKPRTGDKP